MRVKSKQSNMPSINIKKQKKTKLKCPNCGSANLKAKNEKDTYNCKTCGYDIIKVHGTLLLK